MIEIRYFVAWDDEEFEDEATCLEHEAWLEDVLWSVKFFNPDETPMGEQGGRTKDPDEFDNFYNNCGSFIKDSNAGNDFIYNYFGFDGIRDAVPGVRYYWDEDDCDWKEV